MAIMITEECINCGACEPECPNTAIYEGGVNWELAGKSYGEGDAARGQVSDGIAVVIAQTELDDRGA